MDTTLTASEGGVSQSSARVPQSTNAMDVQVGTDGTVAIRLEGHRPGGVGARCAEIQCPYPPSRRRQHGRRGQYRGEPPRWTPPWGSERAVCRHLPYRHPRRTLQAATHCPMAIVTPRGGARGCAASQGRRWAGGRSWALTFEVVTKLRSRYRRVIDRSIK